VKSEGRFLFDECIGKPLMLELQSMVAPDSEFRHIVDTFRAGEKDEIWIPRLGAEGDWIAALACIWPKIELLRAARPVPVTTSDTEL
jgi:hypothetical protein